jgi:hypothetical protein
MLHFYFGEMWPNYFLPEGANTTKKCFSAMEAFLEVGQDTAASRVTSKPSCL